MSLPPETERPGAYSRALGGPKAQPVEPRPLGLRFRRALSCLDPKTNYDYECDLTRGALSKMTIDLVAAVPR